MPEPDEYPASPITQAEDFTSERPPTGPVELVSRPIRTGFLLTVGVGLALAVYVLVSSNVQLLVWILAAIFITLGLDPIVTKIQSWGAPRGVGVAAAVTILIGIVTIFISTLIPVIVEQTTEFAQILPTVVSDFIASDFFRAIDDEFDVATVITTEVNKFVSDTSNITTLLGGILGFGTAVVNVGFSVLIVVVLTLYFLASLPTIKQWLYRRAPRSRRERLEYLSEKITGSVGHYIVGQTIVATLNGIVAFIACPSPVAICRTVGIICRIHGFYPVGGRGYRWHHHHATGTICRLAIRSDLRGHIFHLPTSRGLCDLSAHYATRGSNPRSIGRHRRYRRRLPTGCVGRADGHSRGRRLFGTRTRSVCALSGRALISHILAPIIPASTMPMTT